MTIEREISDWELLEQMQAANEEALATLYRRRQGAVYRFVLQMCGSRSMAEDITQEVFLVLIRDSQSVNPARGSVNAFLLGVARNLLLRRLRRERFYVAFDKNSSDQPDGTQLSHSSDGPLEVLSRNETIESVRKAILSLPPNYREVVVLCDLQELNYAEAAAVLDCAVGTVRSRLHRARALLVEKLATVETRTAPARVRSARCFA